METALFVGPIIGCALLGLGVGISLASAVPDGSFRHRRPVITLATGALFAAVAARFPPVETGGAAGRDAEGPAAVFELVAYLYLAAVSVALAVIDLNTHRLPDAIVLPSCAVLVLMLGVLAATTGDIGALARAVTGGVVLCAAYLAMALARPGGMGLGDVKLALLLGLALGHVGWGALVVGAFAAFLLGGVFAVALLAVRRATRRTGIPFGPWMISGAWSGVFVGEWLWSGYLGVFQLA